MDDTLTVGGSTTVESSSAAETAPSGQSADSGNAAQENNQIEGGTEQSGTESGQIQGGQGRKRWSMQDEVKELRSQRRELREQLSQFGSVRDELAALREELYRRNQPQSAKTPANFWQDPEAVLESKLEEKLERLQNNMFERFQMTREQEFAQQEQAQKSASAAEFIRSQPNYDSSDDEDLIDIIGALPKRMRDNSDPQALAEYAWYKLQAQRGVGDRSLQKRQAAGIQGQPPGTGFGRKTWNRSEFDQAVDLVEKNPNDPKMSELFNELMAAHKEGRVK